MQLTQARDALRDYQKTAYALRHAMSVLYVDGNTAASRESWRGRSKATGYLSGQLYQLTAAPENEDMLSTILSSREDCTPEEVREAELIREDLEDMRLFSRQEYTEHQQLLTQSDAVWHAAKTADDYASFAPYLEKLIAYSRLFAERKDAHRQAYDVLLDTYEKGTCMAALDPFFNALRTELTPLIREIAASPQPDAGFLHAGYPAALQEAFAYRVMNLIGLDPDRCTLSTTEHPFTSGCNKWDVRITTHYHEDDVSSSMFSVIHEGGHALYELGVDDCYQFTRLSGGSSMSIHECQSRFYENLIGRSRAFSELVLPAVHEIFPEQTRGVSAEDWYRAVNQSMPTLVRTQADELTYPLHIVIRYELEKRLFSGDLSVHDLPGEWKRMYQEYLGIQVPDDRTGVLQDSHWSGGMFGYFPSYALGSAYGVSILENMNREMNVDALVREGRIQCITDWLRRKIHHWGQFLTPSELLASAGVPAFDPQPYIRYLTHKYRELYHLRQE